LVTPVAAMSIIFLKVKPNPLDFLLKKRYIAKSCKNHQFWLAIALKETTPKFTGFK